MQRGNEINNLHYWHAGIIFTLFKHRKLQIENLNPEKRSLFKAYSLCVASGRSITSYIN